MPSWKDYPNGKITEAPNEELRQIKRDMKREAEKKEKERLKKLKAGNGKTPKIYIAKKGKQMIKAPATFIASELKVTAPYIRTLAKEGTIYEGWKIECTDE